MVKKILIGLVAIFAVLALLPLVLSPKVQIVRSVEINSDLEKTHLFLADFQNFGTWNPFASEDPSSTSEVREKGVGSTFSWNGKKTGEGRMTISAIVPNQTVKIDLEFFVPMPGSAKSEWQTEKTASGGTKVVWVFEQELSYPKRYFGLFMDSMMGGIFETGLKNLKAQVESLK